VSMLDKLRDKLSGKGETIPCVCGGEMVRQDTFAPDPYHPSFFCENCGSGSDGVVFHPSEEFEKTERYKKWKKKLRKSI